MNVKKVMIGFIALSILILCIASVSAVEVNTTKSIYTAEESNSISVYENEDLISASDDSEQLSKSNLEVLDQHNSENELSSGEIDRVHWDNDYDNENYYDYVLNYKGKDITVEFTKNQINKIKNGQVVEVNTGVTMKVPIYKTITKTTTKYIKTKIWAWKYYKNTKKIKWNKKYISKTFKNAMKKGKYLKTKTKKTKYGKICYQTWKIPKKIKKSYVKQVYQNKQIIANMFKSTGGQYPKGYWIGLGYDGADRDNWKDYKVNI